jgi:hypothetical protein
VGHQRPQDMPTNSGEVADLYGVVCTTKKGSTDLNDFAFIYVPAHTPAFPWAAPTRRRACRRT